MSENLHTLGPGDFRAETEVKASRFLAIAERFEAEGEFRKKLKSYEQQYKKANHVCYAYRLDADTFYVSDAGEPGGSAGRPILQAIDSAALGQVGVFVVRWFGGVKLGVGGLKRAYFQAAKECLSAAHKKEVIPTTQIYLEASFDQQGALMEFLRQNRLSPPGPQMRKEGVRYCLEIPKTDEAGLMAAYTIWKKKLQ